MNYFKAGLHLLGNKFPWLISDKPRRAVIDGVTFELDLSETIDRHIYYQGMWEPNTVKALQRYIRPDMTVVEIGSNIGAHTFLIADILRRGTGKLYSFEPSHYAHARLMRNAELNRFENIRFEKKGVSDKPGRHTIDASGICFRSSWNVKRADVSRKIQEDIELVTLDGYAAQMGLDRLDFLKIDTDGYEYRILRGAEAVLRDFRPALLIELGRTVERVGDRLEDLMGLLVDHGYAFHSIKNDALRTREEIERELATVRTIECVCTPA